MTKRVFVIGVLIHIFIVSPVTLSVLQFLSLGNSDEIFIFTFLGFLITSLILSILLLPNLRRSIDRAIHKRMAEE